MTKDEILKNCTWDRYDMASLEIEIPILKTKATVTFIPNLKSGKEITDDMTKALNDILNLNDTKLTEIKDFLFYFFNLCCEVTSYGFEMDVADEDTLADANKKYFEVKNKEDALKKSNLEQIVIEGCEGRVAKLYFHALWEDEHGCEIVIRNGEVDRFKE